VVVILVKAMQQPLLYQEGRCGTEWWRCRGAQQHGLVVLDPKGEVIKARQALERHGIVNRADFLCHRLSSQEWVAACGSLSRRRLYHSKLAWLRRCEPESFKRIGRVLLLTIGLTYRLTGPICDRPGDASGTVIGLLERIVIALTYFGVSLMKIDWPELLPRVLALGRGGGLDCSIGS